MAISALIERANVELVQGELLFTEFPTQSGQGQRVGRCPRCSVVILSHYAYGKLTDEVVFVRVGTLDKPSQLPPDIHIYTSTKQPWLVLPEGVPAVSEFYRASEYWSPASLARRAQLLELKTE